VRWRRARGRVRQGAHARIRGGFLSPFVVAERGYIDEVIMPRATRRRVARALAMLRGKTVEMPPRKHDNLPL
jgi:propionyl-CoA carboxylase beta chain